MRLTTIIKASELSFDVDGEDAQYELALRCSPTRQSAVLEIGEHHVFANRARLSALRKRGSCNLQVFIERKSDLSAEEIKVLGLSDSRIGSLAFVPPEKTNFLWRSRRAALNARVFVNAELFESLMSALPAGRKAIWLNLEIEKQGVLKYGWEPDGSRIVWSLESSTEPSNVYIVSMEIGFVHSLSILHRIRALL